MYDKHPYVPVSAQASDCAVGWPAIAERLRPALQAGRVVLGIECYPGVFTGDLHRELLPLLQPALVIDAEACFLPPRALAARLQPCLGDDPVFGRMNGVTLADFLDAGKVAEARCRIARQRHGRIVAVGSAASLVADCDVLVYADLARWEIQRRQRRGEIANLGAGNFEDRAAAKYKRAYFVDWRAADRRKKQLLAAHDFLLDTNDRPRPKLISGECHRQALRRCSQRPFRVVPYFDPGPWGGHWMERVCDLPGGEPNHAWCFDCVPEENSLMLGFGDARVEIPSQNLVYAHPRELLGDAVHARFGAEFPIRFDFLDTMGGGNLSLQVHPLTEYIQDQFGMHYTQDESYYLLDAAPGAGVYLGLREGIEPAAMLCDLRRAQDGGGFDASRYVNRWPAEKHDHFLIPAGTVHCSGRDSMVLEISATPYIFTFKLWDWGRLGLDGRPRPLHLEHGAANIQWERSTRWVERNLIHRVSPVAAGKGWREERTGLHEREFIETRRHWFTGRVPHETGGGVNVLNLVEGEAAVIESASGAFEPYAVHYAETFIVPAAVGRYTIRPARPNPERPLATLKAFVRCRA